VSLSIGDGVFAASNIPFTPRGDYRKVGCKRRICELKAHLVVALSGATVRKRIGPNLPGDFDLATRNQWASHGCSEQVFAPVDGTGTQRRPDEILDELLTEILDVAFVGARGDRLGAHTFQFFSLTDVCRDANNTGVVALLEPGNDDRSIKPAGIGEGNCTNHGRLNKYSE